MDHDPLILKHRLGGLQATTGQDPLQGKAGDPSKNPAQVGSADAQVSRDAGERHSISEAALDELKNRSDDLEVLSGDLDRHLGRGRARTNASAPRTAFRSRAHP
jgi:hypothetical protein